MRPPWKNPGGPYDETGPGFIGEGLSRADVGNRDSPVAAAGSTGATLLQSAKEQIRAAPDAVLDEEVGDMKLGGALGHMKSVGDFLVGQIVENGVEDLPFAAREPFESGRIDAGRHVA